MVRRFFEDERGMETVEWAVVAALLVIGVIVIFSALGGTVQDKLSTLQQDIENGGSST